MEGDTHRKTHVNAMFLETSLAQALDFKREVRSGSCVTSVAGPNGDAQLYER